MFQQTIKGYDEMRRRVEKESTEMHTQLHNEISGVRKLLEIEEQKGCKLREEITLRDELNVSLRYDIIAGMSVMSSVAFHMPLLTSCYVG